MSWLPEMDATKHIAGDGQQVFWASEEAPSSARGQVQIGVRRRSELTPRDERVGMRERDSKSRGLDDQPLLEEGDGRSGAA